MAKTKQQTRAVIEQRVTEILDMRLAGAQFHDIQQHSRESGWGSSVRQLWRYIAKTDEILAAKLEGDRGQLINRHLAQRKTIYAKTMQGGDYRTALSALQDEAELLGLYPDAKKAGGGGDVAVQVNVGLVALTPEQRRTELLGIIDSVRERIGSQKDSRAINGQNGHANGHCTTIANGASINHVGNGTKNGSASKATRQGTNGRSHDAGDSADGHDAPEAR